MDRQRVDAWLDGYRRAWEQADSPAVVGLFTTDASYRSHPLRPAHTGHDGVAAYWGRATADQRDVRVRFGDPVVDRDPVAVGDRVAVEWWTTMTGGGAPATLVGCLLLAFAADGRCRALRECWHEAEEVLDPPRDWGRIAGPDPAGSGAGDEGREYAGRWADGYERAWRAGDPEAAAALYAPDSHYRSAPFRDPTWAAPASSPSPAAPTPPRPARTPTSAPRSPPALRPRSSGGPPCSRRAARPPSSAPRS